MFVPAVSPYIYLLVASFVFSNKSSAEGCYLRGCSLDGGKRRGYPAGAYTTQTGERTVKRQYILQSHQTIAGRAHALRPTRRKIRAVLTPPLSWRSGPCFAIPTFGGVGFGRAWSQGSWGEIRGSREMTFW